MTETNTHRRWRLAGRPDRYYDVEAFNYDGELGERVDVRTARVTSAKDAELWLIERLTPARPFGEGRAHTVVADAIEDPETGQLVDDIYLDDADGWCHLDNAAAEFEREGRWLPDK